jgi:hypothetical protein
MQKGKNASSASLKTKADITQQTIALSMGSFGVDPYSKARDLKFQLSGGPNNFNEDLQMGQHREILSLNPMESEILTHTLSLLLACVRVRFDAAMQSKGELIPQEDLDSLNIIHRLSSYLDPDNVRFMQDMAEVLGQAIANGHNS